MSLSHTITVLDALESPRTTGKSVADLVGTASGVDVTIERLMTDRGRIDVLRIVLEGQTGRRAGGSTPSLGIVGRPDEPGSSRYEASIGAGAVVALATARKLVALRRSGGVLAGDVVIVTQVVPDPHVGPALPTHERHVGDREIASRETAEADGGVVTVGRVSQTNFATSGLALTPTVCRGTILPAAHELVRLMAESTGASPALLAVSAYDLANSGDSSVAHLLRPQLATPAPVAGVALTSGHLPLVMPREALLATAVHTCVALARSWSDTGLRLHDEARLAAFLSRRQSALAAL